MITKKDELIQHMRDFYNNLTDEQVTERFVELGFERVGSGKGEIIFDNKMKIEAWKATDGKLFENEVEYLKHQKKLDLKQELSEIVDDIYYYNISSGSIVDGIIEQFDKLEEVINKYKKI